MPNDTRLDLLVVGCDYQGLEREAYVSDAHLRLLVHRADCRLFYILEHKIDVFRSLTRSSRVYHALTSIGAILDEKGRFYDGMAKYMSPELQQAFDNLREKYNDWKLSCHVR